MGRYSVGADRGGSGVRGRRSVRVMAYASCGALLLAGCASMPDSGDLRQVESTPRQDSQVRVYAIPPRPGASADEIVRGFLEALTSDDANYETAGKYLTDGARKTWDPYDSTTVLDDAPEPVTVPTDTKDGTRDVRFRLNGSKIAGVDERHAYEPAAGTYNESVRLTKLKNKQWRIDALPQGVVMGSSDFQRNYVSVNKYYYASNGISGAGRPLATVADPVYVRAQVDPMTQIVRALLRGPTKWLDPEVTSSFPTGTDLKSADTSLSTDDRNRVTVPLNGQADHVGNAVCERMAAQVLLTLTNLTPTGVDEVELQRSDGSQLCVQTKGQAAGVASHGTGRQSEDQYFIDHEQRLVRMDGGDRDKKPEPVPGALGEGVKKLRAAAVSRDETTAAGVSADGRNLYVGTLVSGGSLGEPVLRSQGSTPADRLTTPSWDARGDLWVADRDPKKPRLLLLNKGAGDPVVVQTPLVDGRIEAVRVAADGVRIALIVEKDGKSSLQIGRIDRSAGDEPAGADVVNTRVVAPRLEEVTAMSWAGDSRLVVVGSEKGGVQQMRYVQVDGSTPPATAPSALANVKEIAASEDETLPLVAQSETDGIVRLSAGEQWQKIVQDGTAPVYPG
ncbi:LpqB family beta-propeller domain-containing protein [Streptomyces sp. NBC_01428]|uniref:LpqB family beta-propeller domain-containing protein n=1 Tax=Streptomyces sp. NBC_01428 TaxID=2903861 RepID=UPI002E34DAD9|nr:LpqB family beta-propeller domain-containing protein [Streptomyces sp. NBC_01428]